MRSPCHTPGHSGLVCLSNGKPIPVITWSGNFSARRVETNSKTSWSIEYLGIDCATMKCIWKRWNIMRRFTSRPQICDITEIDRNAGEHSRKPRNFSTYLTTLRWDFVILKIEEWEVNLRICMQLLCIHYFKVWSITKYLIGPDVLPSQFPG